MIVTVLVKFGNVGWALSIDHIQPEQKGFKLSDLIDLPL